MFQFHQNNYQLLFHVIVSPLGAGAFSRGFTKILAWQCRAFSRALKIEKLKAPLFPGPGGAGDANDWCINVLPSTLRWLTRTWFCSHLSHMCYAYSPNDMLYDMESLLHVNI